MRLTTSEPNPWRKIIGNEQVLWDSFFISFNFQADYIAAIVSDYGQSLMALECAEQGYAGDKIGVDTIFVRTMYDYNDTYAAGDTINQIVLIKDWIFFYDDFEKFVPLSNYIVDNHNGVIDQQFQFKLSEAPGKVDSFSIQLSFILNNGEAFQHTTNPLVLTK